MGNIHCCQTTQKYAFMLHYFAHWIKFDWIKEVEILCWIFSKSTVEVYSSSLLLSLHPCCHQWGTWNFLSSIWVEWRPSPAVTQFPFWSLCVHRFAFHRSVHSHPGSVEGILMGMLIIGSSGGMKYAFAFYLPSEMFDLFVLGIFSLASFKSFSLIYQLISGRNQPTHACQKKNCKNELEN